MKRHLAVAVAAAFGALMALAGAEAADLSKQKPIEVVLLLGTETGDLVFTPNELTFEKGTLYKLVLKNPSTTKHRFAARGLNAVLWTRKLEVDGGEVKGRRVWKGTRNWFQRPVSNFTYMVRDIELEPGGEAEWVFVPTRAGILQFRSGIPAYADAGMVGEIIIR